MRYPTAHGRPPRSDKSVAVSLSPDRQGGTRVISDGLRASFQLDACAWQHERSVTETAFDAADLRARRLEQQQLAALASQILRQLLR